MNQQKLAPLFEVALLQALRDENTANLSSLAKHIVNVQTFTDCGINDVATGLEITMDDHRRYQIRIERTL